MSKSFFRHIAIEIINKFIEDTKIENLNDAFYSRLVMTDGEELIHSDRVAEDNIHSLFQDLRKYSKFKKKKSKWMMYS